MKIKKTSITQSNLPVVLLLIYLLANLIIAVFIVDDYGQSTDENFVRNISASALSAYSFDPEVDYKQVYLDIGIDRYYGTGLSMLFLLGDRIFGSVLGTSPGVVSHFLYFCTFIVAIFSFYHLMLNFTSNWNALTASLVFGTQPLLFGHAFINPKDIPILAVFLSTVAIGYRIPESIEPFFETKHFPSWIRLSSAKNEWNRLKNKRYFRIYLIGVATIGILIVFIKQLLNIIVPWFFSASADSLLGKFFRLFSSEPEAIGLEYYLNKVQNFAPRWALYLLIGMAILFFLVVAVDLSSTYREKIKRGIDSYLRGLQTSIKQMPLSRYGFLILAGTMWGIAISTRVIGIAAGVLVGLYLLVRFKQNALFPLIVYFVSAILVCYALWPYLWFFGLQGFWEAIQVFSKHPWETTILFEGAFFKSTDLPWYYMVKLIAIQYTVPVIILSVIGFFVFFKKAIRHQASRLHLLLLFSWLVLPIFFTVLRNSTQYDNFRQYLFITPPVFIFMGVSLEWLSKLINKKLGMLILTILIIAPGVRAIAQLHPFQYIYYNSFTGGVSGAYRQYPMDYWLTSYQKTAEWVDKNIPNGSSLLVYGGGRRIEPFVNNQYKYGSGMSIAESERNEFDYFIITTELQLDRRYHQDAEELFVRDIQDVPLVYVKKNKPTIQVSP